MGNTYRITGTNTTSVYITVAETTTAFGFGGTIIIDGASTVSFTATTPEILIYWHLDMTCTTQTNENTATTIQCTSASCTCTATAAPGVATGPTPVDMAIDVPIDDTDPANLVITTFSWLEDTVIPAESFNLSLDTTPTGDDIGTITGAINGNVIVFGWTTGTTYFWKVTAINCFGSTESAVWSFTTEADPTLSTPEFNTASFSVFPNPAKDVISIKTDVSLISADVYNQLGQRVMQINTQALINKTININNLNNGIYFLKINAEDKQQTIKFIKE